jgi:sterol desaturase/sphingolipid hydroxylase (fatty acid hydroxylase superfamily)
LNLNPIVLSIPIFFILIGIELIAERISNQKVYRLPDAIANLSCGITSQLSGIFLKVFAIGVYSVLFQYFNVFEWERNWIYWTALFLLADHSYYWAHRMSHQINLFWGGHVVHHQSEDYNLSVALRQSTIQVIWTFAFSLPLAFLGFEPLDFALMSAFLTLYQFWIHTEMINKMGWFEYLFNTPSHHRVHHGRNPKYIDKNHAGTLIIWDKMYGTFQVEEEKPTYGITKQLKSWNAVWANFSHYAEMSKDLNRIPTLSDKIKYLFKKPGWLPDYLGGYRAAPEVDKATHQKFDSPNPYISLNLYVLFQFALCLVGTGLFLFKQSNFDLQQKVMITVLISWVVVNCGVLFENKTWVEISEWLRIIVFSSLLGGITYYLALPVWLYSASVGYLIISGVWFFAACKQKRLTHAV